MQGAYAMEKAKAITAYLKGFITLQECQLILGLDAAVIQEMTAARVKEERPASASEPVPHS